MSKPYNKNNKRRIVAGKTLGVCRDFQRGRCTKGAGCRYDHAESAARPNNPSVSATLLSLIIEKYNLYQEFSGALDLSSLWHMEEVRDQDVHPFDPSTHLGAETIAKVIHESYSDVVHLSLRNNNITDPCNILVALAKAGQNNLISLTLCNNPIKDVKFISVLKQFPQLQTLNLAECECNPPATRRELQVAIASELPWLLTLDDVSIVQAPLSLPWTAPVEPLFDDLGVNPMNVLKAFYDALSPDHGVLTEVLSALYAESAMLTVNVAPTCRFEVPRNLPQSVPLQVMKDFTRINNALQAQSHNLGKVKSAADVQKASNTIIQGKANIVAFLLSTMCPNPQTSGVVLRHAPSKASMMRISAVQWLCTVAGVINIESTRVSNVPVRGKAFHRTLVMTNDGTVTNDTWLLQNLNHESPTWVPAMGSRTTRVKAQFPSLTDDMVADVVKASCSDVMFVAIADVVHRTGLLPHVARSLLESVQNWSVDDAMKSFADGQSGLTPDFFYATRRAQPQPAANEADGAGSGGEPTMQTHQPY
eukprot:PhM_4_TR5251/c0_g1_i1/m.41962